VDNRIAYTRTAVSLHWLIAVLVFAGWGLGFYMADLPASPAKLRYVSWHKWIGISVFLLALLRAAWRATHAPPALPVAMQRWQAAAARISQFLLYVLLLVIPLSGWLMSSAKGFQTVYFGLLPLPDLLDKDEALGKFLAEIHELLGWTLATLVAVHSAAALKHHFLDRDDVLRRMLPALAVVALLAGAAKGEPPVKGGTVGATFRQMKVPVEGTFGSFRGGIRFDPGNLAAAGAHLEVDTASFTLGAPEYDAEVRKKEWFDSATYPHATFVASKVSAGGGDRYVATGTLTLKGRSVPLEVPFTVLRDGPQRFYEGEFALSRKAFGIGDPQWDDVLEDKVVVRFRLLTKQQ
jgi:cytochrome b561